MALARADEREARGNKPQMYRVGHEKSLFETVVSCHEEFEPLGATRATANKLARN